MCVRVRERVRRSEIERETESERKRQKGLKAFLLFPYGTVLTSGAYKLGTSPAFKILLMSSTMRSLIILKQAEEKNVKTIKLTIKRLE